MIDEIHFCGVYVPSALAWALVAGLLVYLLRTATQRLPLGQALWHAGLVDLALFFLAWWALVSWGDAHGIS